jgi:hypothetical protein
VKVASGGSGSKANNGLDQPSQEENLKQNCPSFLLLCSPEIAQLSLKKADKGMI